jgi:hypothetical protein
VENLVRRQVSGGGYPPGRPVSFVRTGYHDTHDTMENIDLEYGAAVCAITIEAVARAASPTASPL